jgi:Family of unknown function (DUF6328)
MSDLLARAGLSLLALAVSSVALLIFDVVVGRLAGVLASACLLTFFAVCCSSRRWRYCVLGRAIGPERLQR